MSISTIGQPQAYGTPLFSPLDLDNAQVVIILENPSDPKQPERSARSLFHLGTSEYDDLLVQAPKNRSYSSKVISKLYDLTHHHYNPLDFSRDPESRGWDLDEVYEKASTIGTEISRLQRELEELDIFTPSSDVEKYQSIIRRVFNGVSNGTRNEHQSPQEFAFSKEILKKAIEDRKDKKLRELATQYLPKRQTSLIETLRECIDERADIPEKMMRRIYVLCESAHGYINPKTNLPNSPEVERLVNFIWSEKRQALTIIDASSDSCMKKASNTVSAD